MGTRAEFGCELVSQGGVERGEIRIAGKGRKSGV